ncbi:MAG: hypothetical protein M3Q14_02915 [bacterium]|nr:hypothetical protein [bacterium]
MIRWLRMRQLARPRQAHRSGAGYTITETLIVLAVTTVMFTAVALLFSGRQARTEFTQAVRDFEGRLETLISEVVNGHYSSNGFKCIPSASGPPAITATPGNTGSSEDCIFVGKVIQADPSLTSSKILTLIGRRTVSVNNSDNVNSMTEAQPVVATAVDFNYNHNFQLELERFLTLDTNTEIAAIGFINKFSRGVNTSGSGNADLVDLYGLLGPAGTDLTPTANRVNLASFNELTRGVRVCLHGQNNQRAEITIGANGNPTSLVSTLDTRMVGPCSV